MCVPVFYLINTKYVFLPAVLSFISSYNLETKMVIALVSNYGDNVWKLHDKIKIALRENN